MSLSGIAAFPSEATCGEACWEAREDICRCSCGGRNHGCLRSADGVRPERSAKLNGHRYVLKAVGDNLCGEAEKINQAAGVYYRYIECSREAALPAMGTRAARRGEGEPIMEEAASKGAPMKRPLTYAEGQAAAGRQGGKSTSRTKRRAAKINLAKARIRRWPKGKQ